LTRFEKSIAVAGPLIAAGGIWLGIANYKHTVQHDQDQQMGDVLKASSPPGTTLPNLNTKPVEKPAQQQTSKDPNKQVEQPQQNSTNSQPSDTTPKEPPKEEPKPFTFWGYFQSGQQLRPGIMFQVNSCSVGKTLVTCSMEAVSPRFDRTFYLNASTSITDHEGDPFPVQFTSFTPLQLDRNAPAPFRLSFPVNKDVVEPITVRINGYDTNGGNIQKASFVIGSKDQQK
jgi:hypothetical protein